THPGPLNVYFHVVAANETVEGGWIPDRAIDAQMTVLNEDFASTGVQWVLAGVDRTETHLCSIMLRLLSEVVFNNILILVGLKHF
ncbi:hypothetical protein BDQ17DRAFT_1454227, partial [Cyathus striatus]